MTTNLHAILIEDNPADAHLFKTVFLSTCGTGGNLHHCSSLKEGTSALTTESCSILFEDLNLPDSDAEQTLEFIREVSRRLPVVVITGIEKDELVERALEAGAQDFLVKGQFDSTTLKRTVRYAIERQKLVQGLRDANHKLSEALNKIRTLEGLLPICSYCKKIRDKTAGLEEKETSSEDWVVLEAYLTTHSDAKFTHSICPDCMQKVRAELEEVERRRELL